jgi:exopolysaccharide biosynthesis polyprenyl glycosylphosphotransferase
MKSFWKGHFLTLVLVFLDVAAYSLIWRWSWEIRRSIDGRFGLPIIDAFGNYSDALPRLLVVWIVITAYFEHYSHRLKISSLNQTSNILKAGIGLLIGSVVMAFLFKTPEGGRLGRAVILLSTAGMTVYLYVGRTLLRAVKTAFVERGHGLTRIAIVGAGKTGREVAAHVLRHPEIGYEIVGFIDRDPAKRETVIDGIPVIGGEDGLVDLLLRHRVEEVFLAVPSLRANEAFRLVNECERAKVNFKLVTADLLQVITDRVKIDEIGDFSVILLRDGHLTPIESLLKRLMDLAIAIPMLLLSAPLMLIVARRIRRDTPGPAIFVQERVGRDGRRFKMFKFRTMHVEVEPYQSAPDSPDDPRVTRFGRWLRKTSFDEFPQLWNVIRGDMSMVGPRPEMPFIVERYEPWQMRRLDVPQGITGLWQIAGRKQLPLHLNLEYDFYYIRNWSLLLDVVILLRTFPAVFFGSGAY